MVKVNRIDFDRTMCKSLSLYLLEDFGARIDRTWNNRIQLRSGQESDRERTLSRGRYYSWCKRSKGLEFRMYAPVNDDLGIEDPFTGAIDS